MDLEAAIIERLEKLRQWQIEQQERLLMQQHVQREMLTQKQDCIYKALELSMQELNIDENVMINDDIHDTEVSQIHLQPTCTISINSFGTAENEDNILKRSKICDQDSNNLKAHSIQVISDTEDEVNSIVQSVIQRIPKSVIPGRSNSNHIEVTPKKQNEDNHFKVNSPEKQGKSGINFLMDGIALLPSQKAIGKQTSIDDIPVPSPKKDFHALLEERLRDSDNAACSNTKTVSNPKVKKPFLKKGQGLSRFCIKQDTTLSKPLARSRSASLSTNIRSNTKNIQSRDSKSGKNPCTQSKIRKDSCTNVPRQNQLSLRNVPLPKKKVRSKSESSSTSIDQYASTNHKKNMPELSTSDFQNKTQKEMEEVRIFELLEEKAENSSFCSTSSAVVAFLQQSTPFKIKKTVSGVEHSMINIKQKTSPIIKNSIIRHQFNRTNRYPPNIETGTALGLGSVKEKSTSFTTCSDTTECTKSTVNSSTMHSATNSVQRSYSKKRDACDSDNAGNDNEVDVSLHVRFAEYNEYKTIGLTDVSSISNESGDVCSFVDNKSWDDTLNSNGSDTDTSSIIEQQSESPTMIQNNVLKDIQTTMHQQCNTSNEIIHFTNSENILRYGRNDNHGDNFESLYYNDEELESTDVTIQTSDDEREIVEKYHTKLASAMSTNNNTNRKLFTESNQNNTAALKKNSQFSSNDVAVQTNSDNDRDYDERIFKSEILKTRLLELEKEIDIFRKENIALSKQKQKLQEDREKLCREYAETKKQLEESRKQAENQLQQEKKKVARERNALESRMRDAQERAQQSKLERQEIQNLKDELQQLREELISKESRWNAAESRHKCQVRILKMENAKLKQEVERLTSSKKLNSKGKMIKDTNTKSMHQINKQLNMQNKENYKNIKESLPNNEKELIIGTIQAMCSQESKKDTDTALSNDGKNGRKLEGETANKRDIYKELKKSEQNIAKRRTLYETLLKEATLDLTEVHDMSQNVLRDTHVQNAKSNNAKVENQCISSENVNDNIQVSSDTLYAKHDQESNGLEELRSQRTHFSKMCLQNEELNASLPSPEHPPHIDCEQESSSYQDNNSKLDKQNVRHVHHPDGRTEFWYPNGNVKKVFPDVGITKMIYYNGDVRETNQDGKVKYFYASTRTWHTTTPDGLEILEFPDGQVERRLSNGTVEVSFPDGSVRLVQSDGTETWTLADGTIVETFPNGEKVLTLLNGQKEVHTKAHKRREYPDGTVKLVYPDGTQETRYSNGRTRLKDKEGNLLMDSFQ